MVTSIKIQYLRDKLFNTKLLLTRIMVQGDWTLIIFRTKNEQNNIKKPSSSIFLLNCVIKAHSIAKQRRTFRLLEIFLSDRVKTSFRPMSNNLDVISFLLTEA